MDYASFAESILGYEWIRAVDWLGAIRELIRGTLQHEAGSEVLVD